MDLTLKTSDGTDLMVLSPESADFEWGGNRNDFELVFPDAPNQPKFERWGYVYQTSVLRTAFYLRFRRTFRHLSSPSEPKVSPP